jgi:probable F420-dependent oxidoreductase
VKVQAGLVVGDLAQVPARARAAEAAGYDAVFSAEIANDPFFPLLLAAEHTESIGLMTAISVAFARNPMTVANLAHDLNVFSKGRFSLGLGSQIKPHITRRLSMPWSRPAARMREFILAMRAIWSCWYEGRPLDFRGEFYTHNLMTPMFTPTDKAWGAPRVLLAGVGPIMTRVAGEVADGLIAHAFTTRRYMEEVTIPALDAGLARAGRRRQDFEITCPVFVVTGMDAEARDASRRVVRQQIAFYGSTPAYKPVLELHGWDRLHDELHRLSKQGGWQQMGELIGDEVLAELAIVAEPDAIAAALASRWGGLLDSWLCTVDLPDSDAQSELVRTLQG